MALSATVRSIGGWAGCFCSLFGALSFFVAAVRAEAPAVPSGESKAAAPAAGVSSEPLFAASFKDFDRRLQPLAQYRGKPMLVYFWATWCTSCKEEIPQLKALHAKYSGRALQVIGISADNTDKVRAYAREHAIEYPLLLGSNDAIDLSRKLGNTVGGLPFAVIVDARGTVVATVLGEAPSGRFEELVRPLL